MRIIKKQRTYLDYAYNFSMISSYFLTTTFRLTFNVGPNSPVGIEKSCGKIVNFWIFWAFEIAC